MLIRENVPGARKMSPRIKIRWYAEKLLVALPLFGLTYMLFYLLALNEHDGLGSLTPAFVFVVAISLAGIYAIVEMRYRKFVYALREKDFLIQKGLVEKIRYVIPYEKIQNVTVSRDIVDIALGLGTLHVETAAHVIVDNDILLPGISNEDNLVNELIERSRAAKSEERGAAETPQNVLDVMRQMLDELKVIRASLGRKGEVKPPAPLTHPEAQKGEPIADQLKKTGLLIEKRQQRKRQP
ncbi:MAG: PH domain-containing protein [Candidatus Micrarchaeia archaeon]